MCEICRHSPCHSQCPNYEPRAFYICDICGDPIVAEDEFVEIDDKYYHIDCLNDNYTPSEILEMLGISTRIAMEDD